MSVGVPVPLGTFFTSVSAGSQAITPTANLSPGQVIYLWRFSQSSLGVVSGSGGAGAWVSDVAEFNQSGASYGQLLRYTVPSADAGSEPAFTISWTGGNHTAIWSLFGLTGALGSSPTLLSATALYNNAASPLTGPSLTPSLAKCRIITCYGQAASASSASSNSGAWTSLMTNLQASKSSLVDYLTALGGTAAVNDTANFQAIGLGVGVIFAVQPAAVGASLGPSLGLGVGLGGLA